MYHFSFYVYTEILIAPSLCCRRLKSSRPSHSKLKSKKSQSFSSHRTERRVNKYPIGDENAIVDEFDGGTMEKEADFSSFSDEDEESTEIDANEMTSRYVSSGFFIIQVH